MALKKINSLQGVDIKLPNAFAESYDNTYKIRKYGSDNLFPQQVRQFYRASPTLHKCVSRLAEHLFGEYEETGLLNAKIVEAICLDYSLYGGCALHVNYDAFGEIAVVDYVPFETVRLGEQGANGLYTQCTVCPDWSGNKTVNKRVVKPSTDKTVYWCFTSNIETRLRRMEQAGGAENYIGEILYISNTLSYPESIDAILPIVSMEIGIVNALYRDVRCNAQPSMVVSIARGDDNADQFADNLSKIQGDLNLGKIILYEYASMDEKPELLNLSPENYDQRFEQSKEYVRSKILGFFKQEVFSKIEDGSLGFSSNIIADAYTFYNFSIRPIRQKLVNAIKVIDANFDLPELQYTLNNNTGNDTV